MNIKNELKDEEELEVIDIDDDIEEEKEVVEIMDCPLCDGKIVEKPTRRGKVFYGCTHYPKCKFATWDKPTGEMCPECGKVLVEKSDKVKCSECEYEK